MRYMLLVKANEETEAGVMPPRSLFEEMGRFNEELSRAGVLLALDGLQPSSDGARIRYEGQRRTVTDGPFAEAKELVAGFWLIQVKSREEAVEWAKRAPFQDGVVEVRRVSEASDFPEDVFPPEEAAREEALRAELERRG